jgi:hypothetical protein
MIRFRSMFQTHPRHILHGIRHSPDVTRVGPARRFSVIIIDDDELEVISHSKSRVLCSLFKCSSIVMYCEDFETVKWNERMVENARGISCLL